MFSNPTPSLVLQWLESCLTPKTWQIFKTHHREHLVSRQKVGALSVWEMPTWTSSATAINTTTGTQHIFQTLQSRGGRCYNGNGKGSVSRRRQVEEFPAEICTAPFFMHNYCLGPQIFKFNHIRVSLLFYSLSIIKDISRWQWNFKSQ